MNQTTQPVAIVDDDIRMLESVDDLLASAGFSSRMFNSAESFLGANVLDSIACLISDVGLPGMNGCELASVVKSHDSGIPIIMITGRETPELRLQCTAAGAEALFPKPFDPHAVLEVLRSVIEARQT